MPAAATCEVSCTAEPRNTPAANESPPEEFAYVLSGALEVHFAGGQVVRLARGDSIYFDSRIGHAYVSVSRRLARIVGVTSAESGQMASARAAAADRHNSRR